MPKNNPNQSIRRAVSILFAVAGSEEGGTINEIARTVNLRPNTAYRLIRTLEAEKLLSRREHPLRYVIGRTLGELQRLDDDRHLLTVAIKVLGRMHAKLSSASLTLIEADGANTYLRLRIPNHPPYQVIRLRDFVLHPYAKASSLLFLAFAHPDEAAAFFRAHPFESEGKPVWASRVRLDEFIARTRRTMIAVPDFPDPEGGHFRLAAPVFSADNRLLAAIGGYMPNTARKADHLLLIRLVRDAAAQITTKMASYAPRH